jgi:hypothetical protein
MRGLTCIALWLSEIAYDFESVDEHAHDFDDSTGCDRVESALGTPF